MDFLGLSTLTLIDDAIAEIERTTGERARHRRDPARRCEDLSDLPGRPDLRHVPVREQRHARHPAQGQAAAARRPDRAERALPPGPLRSGMVDDFIARKQGKTEVKYELPQLEPILRDTYGVIAYQEQVMRISNVLAGFTLGEADILRKAMGKKKAEVMAKQRGKFVDGAKKNGHQREEGRADLRPDGALRRLRLQQVALDGLRAPGVPDGVPEGELPVALRGGAADDRGAEHRQAGAVSRRVPRAGHSRCCRPTSTRASCASPSSPARACASA